MNEFDFNRGDVVRPPRLGPGDRSFKPRVLAVVAGTGLLTVLLSLIVERRFVWMWLTGTRTSAVVIDREEEIVSWVAPAPGTRSPLYETKFTYRFKTEDGTEVKETIRFAGISNTWKVGDDFEVIHTNDGVGIPASLSHHAENSSVWLACVVGAVVGFTIFVGSVIWLRRIRSAVPVHRGIGGALDDDSQRAE